jgi:long-chain acyl-CoA synthetase
MAQATNPLFEGGQFPQTVAEFLRARAQKSPSAVATCHHVAGKGWVATAWSDYFEEIQRVAAALKRHGLEKGDRLGIMIPTCREWDLIEKAALTLGAVVVGIEPHASVEHKELVIRHSGASALFVNEPGQLEVLSADTVRSLKLIVALAGGSGDDPSKVTAWQAIQADTAATQAVVEESLVGSDPATLIFTSGTTGTPKGILYTHEQCMAACQSLLEIFAEFGESDRVICWLPLANLFQRMVNLCAVGTASSVYFVEDPRQVLDYIQSVEPAVFIGVPRFYEKLHQGIQTRIGAMPVWQKRLVLAALGIADRCARLCRAHQAPPPWLRLLYVGADALVLAKLRNVMGGKIRCMITGSAPCPLEILEFFDAIGLPLLEAYGMSENIVPVAINRLDDYRLGSVGKRLALNEVKIADDGELLVKGPGVFTGYYRSEHPREGFTPDGFYATGDYGYFDEEGYLYLKGRKSEIIKTSTGRRLSLGRIENALRQIPIVDHVAVVGSGRKALTAVMTLDQERLRNLRVSKETDAQLRDNLAQEILLKEQGLAPYERISGCILVKEPFTVQGGELTPNLKLRRAVIEAKHAAAIERLYQELDRIGKSESALSKEREPLILCPERLF